MIERRLKYVAAVRVSNVDKKRASDELPVLLCNYTDVYYNEQITSALTFMAATATFEQRRTFGLRAEDVLITKDSETAVDIGKCAIVAEDIPDLVCGYHLALIRPRPGRILGRYLRWALCSTAARQDMTASATGVTRFGLRKDEIGALTIPMPDLQAQQAIADHLDRETSRVDALIMAKQRTIDLLEERRTALLASAVASPGWPQVRLSLLARIGSGHTPSRDRPEWWENPTIPWITTGDVAQMRGDRIEFIDTTKLAISELGLANSAAELHPAGTVVLSRTASVGFSAIMARPMATSQDFATWTCGPRLRPRFVLLCLRAMRAELLGRLAMGSTHKTIYMPDIEGIRVPLPSLEEQDRVIEKVWHRWRPIDAAVATIQRQITLLHEHRQALITAAVTGELDISQPEAAAA